MPLQLCGAQNIKVSGKITDDTGESLPGVSIGVKGTTLGTITDIEGNFLLEAKTGSVFSCIVCWLS